MPTAPRILCDCGNVRTQNPRTGLATCSHCDGGCVIRNCALCSKYSRSVSLRISA